MKTNNYFQKTFARARVLPALLLSSVLLTSAHADWHSDYDGLLKKYVKSDGVKYKALKSNAEDVAKLHSVTTAIATNKPVGDRATKMSFHLNAYNAWILRAVIDNYPMKSILDVKKDFFKTYPIKVSGRDMSLDYLENEIIRKTYKDARIHFAVNCASASCPPLHNEAFEAKTLEKSLDKLTKDFINSSTGVRISGGQPHISRLFKWFKEDFGDATTFINKYRRKKISGNVVFQDYGWTLNEAR